MPLHKIPGQKAWDTLRANSYATWGARGGPNRVEPVAEPAFFVPFTFNPHSKIFTIGSCFARVIEAQLAERGFSVPTRGLFEMPEFEGLDPAILNNFGTPSIYYELASAFDEVSYDESALFREGADGLYADMQLVHSVPLASLAEVQARRSAIRNVTRMLADCDVLIMTLGLCEVWWDEKAQVYLNVAPHREIFDRDPDRYSLCLLDFAESYAFLEKALDVAFRHGRDDLQVLLTVSPVPLITTFLPDDVMVSSCYSKSLLRTAAQHAAMRHDRVAYLPLYESVTLSDRQLAWQSDLRHVTKSMAHFIASRVLDAFVPDRGDDAKSGPHWADPTGKLDDFDAHMSGEGMSAALRMGRLVSHIKAERYEEALEIAATIDTEPGRMQHAKALSRLGRHAKAIEIIEPICRFSRSGDIAPWSVWVEAITGGGSLADLENLETAWMECRPAQEYARIRLVAPAFAELGDREAALRRYARLEKAGTIPPGIGRHYAELLLEEGRADKALAILDKLGTVSDGQIRWVEALRSRATDAAAGPRN